MANNPLEYLVFFIGIIGCGLVGIGLLVMHDKILK